MARYSAERGVILVDGKLLCYWDDQGRADTALKEMLATAVVEQELNRLSARGQSGNVGVVVMYLGSTEDVLSKVGGRLGSGPFTQVGDLRPRFGFCWNAVRHARFKVYAIWRFATHGAPAGVYLMASRYKSQLG
jgi:hypothetical protein